MINQTVYDKDKENKLFLDALGKNFTPCYSTSIAEIKNCTNTLNKMSFQIPASNGKELGQFVNDPEMPKTEGNYYEAYFKEIFQNIIDNLWQMYLFFAGFFG